MTRLLYFVGILMVALMLSACTESSDTEEASEVNTPEVTEAVQETPTQTATEEAAATQATTEEAPVTQAATEEAAATADVSSTAQTRDSVTPEAELLNPNNGSYSISVSYTLDGSTMNMPSEDQSTVEELVVVSSLGNRTSRPVEVSAEDIVLVDTEDNRFSPEPPNSSTQPALVGAEVVPNESFLGLALFRLPAGTEPIYLEWCIAGNCEQAVQAPIP